MIYRRYVSLGLNDPGRVALAVADQIAGPDNVTCWKPAMCCWYSLAIRATKQQMREIEALWVSERIAFAVRRPRGAKRPKKLEGSCGS